MSLRVSTNFGPFGFEAILCDSEPGTFAEGVAVCFTCNSRVYTDQGTAQHVIHSAARGVLCTPYCPTCAIKLPPEMPVLFCCPDCGQWRRVNAGMIRAVLNELD